MRNQPEQRLGVCEPEHVAVDDVQVGRRQHIVDAEIPRITECCRVLPGIFRLCPIAGAAGSCLAPPVPLGG